MKRNKKRDNLEVNLDFLCEYTEENHLNANDNLLEKLAYRFFFVGRKLRLCFRKWI